ncbi:hypothetical protein JDV02_000874 [Purpureocillium takamizusanense]|uniref:Uncharacterized protein n=1 Tax=Purpureocillium takamizusanense TaxID=2060973 RepID=A0A9Q8V5Z9_9HYPO|nr:uncharacterized protein JDV02_000874 [Purpureocillium takamizusanense]UNI14223.1 hypothetical protein JDV02_000874 [Purpureocillium takamizusanense]
MSNRTLTSALRSLGRRRGTVSALVPCQSRQFSASRAHGVRAVFGETDNSDLNEVLRTIQEKIILPAYLPNKQRKLVFDPKMRSYLQQNPVVIEVEGLEHKFSSIDRFKGIENSKVILAKALENMHTGEDWANLGTLLAGYKKAGIKLKPDHWGKVVRVAGSRGHIYVIIECAKQSDKTGLLLTNRETVVSVLAFVNGKIATNPGGVAEARQALRWAELVLDLLQRPEHMLQTVRPRDRLHFSRVVRGLVLFARSSAVKAEQDAGEAVEQDMALLREEVTLLESLWEGNAPQVLATLEDFAKLNPTPERSSGTRVPQALSGSSYVQVLAQNIKGIQTTRDLLGDEAKSLAPVQDALEEHLGEFVQTAPGRVKGWEDEYEKVVGKRPSWSSA